MAEAERTALAGQAPKKELTDAAKENGKIRRIGLRPRFLPAEM
jgi:hypothetical protein